MFPFCIFIYRLRGFLSIDIDLTELYINQCDINNNFYNDINYLKFRNNKHLLNDLEQQQFAPIQQQQQQQQQAQLELNNEIEVFHGSHKCHRDSMNCELRSELNSKNAPKSSVNGWTRGSYQCVCKAGFYSTRHPDGFNGTIMEVAFIEFQNSTSSYYSDNFICLPCAPGCASCLDNSPCLAYYNWPFR